MTDSIIEPRAVSGFPEWLPEEEAEFQRLLGIVKKGFETFGFAPIETPAAELLEVLASKGEINKQIYTLARPNAAEEERETDMALHFDLTVPLARYVAMNFDKLSFPFRRYQIQKVWRGERPQKGRFREFYQCDIDVIGHESLDPLNDAEIPAVIYGIFTKMQIGAFVIRVSNRKILQGILLEFATPAEIAMEALRIVDRLPKIGADAVQHDLETGCGLPSELAAHIIEIAGISGRGADVMERLEKNNHSHPLYLEGAEELKLLVTNLAALGVPDDAFEVDLSITRGLDYYTGTVYETFLRDYSQLGSICSGGRYDNLASHFTTQHLPGVGISIGLTRLFSNLLDAGIVKPSAKSPSKVLVSVMDRARLKDYFSAATELRHAGIPTEVFLENKRFKAQIKYADKKGIPLVLIAGETEFATGTWLLKDMRNGIQTSISRKELVTCVSSLL
ncbi:MAG TPA: histidine--tRNA ligase [Candidatus Sumerlaeota bacterium]|nr:MAG: Histidine--tRNA ligase [candidate division BRC1 bacterium ADurb.Bin183]HOE62804.1 histidine--tRNA ligase [Candidatus Sumerlaeota bacterium]HRR29668.1 histidine--tRNA ligase [Candidatus Sumerlaeia bacterium]HON50337.1 histidine--tRNA ligase [Candidatus Sumerlaeota bacterium]HOR63553.1 histidine--tRNA ligase [Candidatus Sumerlaeota bacterium]